MVELHNYQEDLLHRVQDALGNDPKARVMMQLPTGGGKTEIAAQLLKGHLTNGRKAVWVTHRRELTEQTCNRLLGVKVPASVKRSWKTDDPDAPAMPREVVILMAQTLGNRAKKGNVWSQYGPNDLMVIDEAHHAPAAGWERSMEQWPGQVLGMTATPWRLSKTEGFDHLFDNLICGPQVADLQSSGDLCGAVVKAPPHNERIRGGELGSDGDYRPGSIESENSAEVMTARALKFWQERVGDRKKTIVYAVSVRHARNLKRLFDDEGIPAGIVLGSTQQKQAERIRTIEEFRNGNLEVLINVAVVTEGFDVPEASCIVITRPTLSLALFMQMVGRGLRAKDGRGDCLILDLADNTSRHELPDRHREWKLEARGTESSGEAPVAWCPKCYAESHAASHYCDHCGHPLGQECTRCKWRPWRRWQREKMCGDAHDLVCDLCHADAHVRAHLPVPKDLVVPREDLLTEEKPPEKIFQDGVYWHLLSPSLESRHFTPGELLTPDGEKNPIRGEITLWRTTSGPPRTRRFRGGRFPDGINWFSLSPSPERYRSTGPWKSLLFEVAEWLIRKDRLPMELPIKLGSKHHVVHTLPEHADGRPFEDWEKLSNGLCLYLPSGSKEICKAVERLNRASPPHEQLYVVADEWYLDADPERCPHSHPKFCDHPGYEDESNAQ